MDQDSRPHVNKEKKNQHFIFANETRNQGSEESSNIEINESDSAEGNVGALSFDEDTKDVIESSSSFVEDGCDSVSVSFTCKACEESFFFRKTYINHKRRCYLEGEHVCPYCGEDFTKVNEKRDHVKAVHRNKRPFLCEICGNTFPYPRALNRHMLSHTKLKLYTCEECGKGFACQSNLRSHAVIHSDEKPFQCEECGQRFRRISTLRFHKRTHTNERPYQCDACGKTFTQPSSLKTHQKLHLGKKPHSCNLCNEKFVMKAALLSHMRTHTKERPFNCKLCSKSFTQSSALKNHVKTHRNDKTSDAVCNSEDSEHDDEVSPKERSKSHHCELCGHSFALKNTLKVHMMRHNGERPFKCDVCYKSFTQSSTLKIHMRTHTGDKPYACKMCDEHFAYSYALQKHTLKHKEVGKRVKEEECLEQEGKVDNIKFNTHDEKHIDPDEAKIEERQQKILLTSSKTADGDLKEENDGNKVILNESSKNISSSKIVHEERHVLFDSAEDHERSDKKVTPMDFLAVFRSSIKAFNS
ncbi:oocyte zinc finger protein XlCOF6-like [Palaemon carinicauda]|uniref:oocyte zinc finger protein XlCOF6-like n=1 Tax=Palaemon carinicauda TaxID=392227 RepID=UPI0035B5BC18